MNVWHYTDANGSPQGPIDQNSFDQLVQSGTITPSTLVWNADMDGWQPLSTVQGSITPSPLQAAVVQSPNLPPTGPGVENLGAQGPPPQVKPSNYMVNSVLVTLFCCWPTGIVAIIKSSKVDGLWIAGDYQGAQEASRGAKKWGHITMVCALLFAVIYGLLIWATGGVDSPLLTE